jgi:hypothetical protein
MACGRDTTERQKIGVVTGLARGLGLPTRDWKGSDANQWHTPPQRGAGCRRYILMALLQKSQRLVKPVRASRVQHVSRCHSCFSN